MQVKSLCSLKNVAIDGEFDFDIVDHIYKSPNCDLIRYQLPKTAIVLRNEFNIPEFLRKIGEMGVLEFESQPFFYSIVDVPEDLGINVISQIDLGYLTNLISYLWFAKDNSSNINFLYTYSVSKKDAFRRRNSIFSSDASGEFKEYAFTLGDFELASQIQQKIMKMAEGKAPILPNASPIGSKYDLGNAYYRPYNTNNRIERAINFLNITRNTSFLPSKISFYITVFETLFTTDNDAIAHKIGERVAFYLGGDSENKKLNYKFIKDAYNIRSKYLHGQSLANNKDKLDGLKKISIDIDNLLRTILTKVILIDSELFIGDNYNDFINNIIF